MERETSCYGVGRSIGWSAIGVDAGEKKEEEKEREKDRGKDRGKDRVLQAVGCQKQAVWAKNSIFLA